MKVVTKLFLKLFIFIIILFLYAEVGSTGVEQVIKYTCSGISFVRSLKGSSYLFKNEKKICTMFLPICIILYLKL